MTSLPTTSKSAPIVGSDPGEGFVYLGQNDGPPIKVDLEEAQAYLRDLVWHMLRAARKDEDV